jgi:hypothetical protein
MAEMMLFDNAGTIQKGYANGLAGLAMKSQGAQRQGALSKLAGIDPQAAMGMQEKLGAQDDNEVSQAAKLMLNFRNDPQTANQIYQAKFVPALLRKMPELQGKFPQQIDEGGWQAAEKFAGGSQNGDTRWIQTVGKDGKPVWAAANNQGIKPTEYGIPDNYSLEIDPATGLPFNHSKRTGAVTSAGGMDLQEDPMVKVNADIEQGIQTLIANNVDPQKINAWAESKLAEATRNGFRKAPNGYVGMSAAEKAGAEAGAKNQSELDYAGKIAQAKFGAELANAPAIEAAKAGAKIEAESGATLKVDAPKAMQKSLQLFTLIDKAIKHPGRAAATGASAMLPWDYAAGTDAKDFLTVQKQLEGKAFLEAFDSLKGGGQITEVEGNKATQAMARLDRAQSEGEYVAALNELKVIAATAYKRAKDRMGGASPAKQSPQAPAKNSKGWTLHTDANGNKAYVSPDGKQFEEVN